MIYPIVAYGDPVLRKMGEDLDEGTDLKELVEDMFETMHNAQGIGLAAPQIGKSIRLFVVDGTSIDDEEEDMSDFRKVFINPEIIEEEGEEWGFEEGCLSIPGIREDVYRHEELLIHYYDENWQEHEDRFGGMKARIIQHEYDHIEGVLFTDHLPPLKKRLLKNRLASISKGVTNAEYRMRFPKLKR